MPKIIQESLRWYSDKMPTPDARDIYTRLVIQPETEEIEEEFAPSNSYTNDRYPYQSTSPRSQHPLLRSLTPTQSPTQSATQSPRLQKRDILRWFTESQAEDASWVLHRLVETIPHLVYDAVSEKMHTLQPQGPGPDVSTLVSTKKKNQTASHPWSATGCCGSSILNVGTCMSGDPIVQFASAIYYAEEGLDDIMVLDVMRIGNRNVISKTRSEVYYRTEDDSALSGRSYVATSGKLVFEPGETLGQIKIPIIDNPLWDTTTEFICILKEEGLKGAILGLYLYRTRVKIIDSNHFPSDEFSDLYTEEDVANCNKWRLLRGYCWMVCNIPNVWCGSVKFVLVDAFHNLWYLLELFMSVYALDYIVNTNTPSSDLAFVADRQKSLILCCIIHLLGVAFAHVLDYHRIGFPIGAAARKFIQQALLRKFLNYRSVARERLPPGKVMMGMEQDIVMLVIDGYVSVLKLYANLGKIACTICFKLLSPLVFGGTYDWHAFLFLLIVPFLLAVFMHIREDYMSKLLHDRNVAHNDFVRQIALTTSNYRLVVDYGLRNHCEHLFTDKQQEYGTAAMQVFQASENNVYFCKWCQTLLLTSWLLYGGLQVVHGTLSLGLFTTNLQLFRAFGDAILQIYLISIGMMNVFPALENITTLMNYPTDIQQRSRLKKTQRAQALDRRSLVRKDMEANGIQGIPIDMMPIVLDFREVFRFEGRDRTLNFIGQVHIHQGQVVAVTGRQGCGKATLLRLIAGSFLPAESAESPIFVPAHLRVANVSEEPMFFGGTLYDNLTYGMNRRRPDAGRERLRSICKLLNLSATITDYLDIEECESWQDIFSGAQCKLLCLVRALVHNSELLCIHKPFSKLMASDAEHVVRALHKHVENKGLLLRTDPSIRRPRTVIWSSAGTVCEYEVHCVLELNIVSGITLHEAD